MLQDKAYRDALKRYSDIERANTLKYGPPKPFNSLPQSPLKPLQEAANAPKIDAADSLGTEPPTDLPKPVKMDLEIPEHLERVGRGVEAIPEVFQNAPKSAFKMMKGFAYDLPKGVADLTIGGVKYWRDTEEARKDPRYHAFKRIITDPMALVRQSLKYNKEYYENFWDSFVEDPFAFISDVTAAASLGGAAIKGLGKAASSSMLRNVGSGIQKAGRYAEWVDPISLAFKGGGALLRKSGIASHLGFGSPNTNTLMENLHLHEAARDTALSERLKTLKGFTPEMADNFNRATHLGDPESIEAVKSNPITKELFEAQDLDEAWLKAARELDPETAYQAKITHAVEYMRHRAVSAGRAWTSNKAKKIRAWVTQNIFDEAYNPEGTFRPGFASLYEQPTGNWVKRLLGHLADDPRADKTYGRLLSVKGGGDYIFDPMVYLPKMWRGFYHNKFKRDFLDSSLIQLMRQDPQGVKVGKFNKKQIKLLEESGFKEMPVDLYKEYFDHSLRVQAIHLRQLAAGTPPGQALDKTKAIIAKLMSKGGFWKPPSGNKIFVRAADSNFMRFALAVPGAFARIYDKVIGSWKVGQTLFNPGFYLQQVVGNSVAAFAYGITPLKMMRLTRKVRGDVPVQMKAGFQEGLPNQSAAGKVLGVMGGVAAELDNAAKLMVARARLDKQASEMTARLGLAGRGLEDTVARQAAVAPQLKMEMDLYTQRLFERALDPYVQLKSLYNKMSGEIKALQLGTHPAAPGEKLDLAAAMRKVHSVGGISGALAVNAVQKVSPGYLDLTQRVQQLFKKYRNVYKNAPKAYRKAVQEAVAEYHSKQTPYASVPSKNMSDLNNKLDNLLATYNSVLNTTTQRLSALGQITPHINDVVFNWQKALTSAAALNPQQKVWKIQNILWRIKRDIGKVQDDIVVRISNAIEQGKVPPHLEMLAREGTKAINEAHDLIGSTNRLHPITRTYVRRALPYYTFAAAVTKLAFNAPYMWPKRIALSNALVKMWKDIIEDVKGNEIGSDILEDYEPLFIAPDGSVIATKASNWSITSPLTTIEAGRSGFQIPSAGNPLVQHPFVRFAIDIAGRPVLRKGQIAPGEGVISIASGEQWKFDGKRFVRTIPRVGIVRALINQFPLLKAIDKALTDYVQTEQGWSGAPDPYRKFGKPQYKIYPSEKILSFFVPTTRVSQKERNYLDKIKTIQILRSMQRAMIHASPEKREKLREAMKRYGAGLTDRTLDY